MEDKFGEGGIDQVPYRELDDAPGPMLGGYLDRPGGPSTGDVRPNVGHERGNRARTATTSPVIH
jgi:hypothetical protein